MKEHQHLVFDFDERVTVFPVVHGSMNFALEVRRLMLEEKWDCLAVPLPESMREQVLAAVQQLPLIHAVTMEEPEGDSSWNYVPIDPCQPVIMAIRIALEEYIPIEFIDMDVHVFEPETFPTPDPYSIKIVPVEKFCSAMIPSLPEPEPESQVDRRVRYMASELRDLSIQYNRTLCVCSIVHWIWLRDAYIHRTPAPDLEIVYAPVTTSIVQERSLYFVLGELPYVAYLYEKARREWLEDEHLSIDGIKQLVIEAREEWLRKYKPLNNWATPQRLQLLLKYIRNLTLVYARLTPDLYTLALAAKQVIGDTYAIAMLETAKQYPFQHLDGSGTAFGIDQIRFENGRMGYAKNRLQGILQEWRTLPLKRVPDKEKQREWQQRWNPYGFCSYPPEDKRIESFNTHVRELSRALIGEGLAKSEKFTTSIKDGLDIRETIRNWHTGNIYVKELPPSRGTIDAVVFLFDTPADPNKYSFHTTWYAEHDEESTLSFYSTPIGERFVGPGIAQCLYGGCAFIFPPKYIPDIWLDPRFKHLTALEDRLLAGALYHSEQKHVALVSNRQPTNGWKWLARRYKKKIIHIPLSRFSQQMTDRLRIFHVLNGKMIRSYAAHFIRDL